MGQEWDDARRSQEDEEVLKMRITKYRAVGSTIAGHNYMPNAFHCQSVLLFPAGL